MAGEPRLMFSTLGCPGWTLEQAADTAVAIGYGGLEIRMLDGTIIPPDLDAPGRTRIREVMQSRELRTIGLGLSTRFTMPDGAERERMEQDLLAYLEMARELDVPFVRTFGGNLADGQATEDGINNVAESLNRLASAAADAGVTILLETHDAFCKGRDVARVLDQVPSDRIMAVWDVHHPWRMGESIEETWACIGERTAHVHLKDAAHSDDGTFRLVLMGEGDVPNQAIVDLLESNGYEGAYSAEWEKAWHPGIEEPEIALPQHFEVIMGWLRG